MPARGSLGQAVDYATAHAVAPAGAAAELRCAVKISRRVENEVGKRNATVGSAGEGMEHRLFPQACGILRKLKHHAAARTVIVAAGAGAKVSTVAGRAIDVPGSVPHDALENLPTIGVARKVVQHGFSPRAARSRSQLVHRTAACARLVTRRGIRASPPRGAV
jgi:hypothetical protein